MNKRVFSTACTVSLGLLAANPTLAQDASSAEEEVYELSPFEVDASQDSGYRATTTIAGSRLNTQLKDVAASVSVLTNEFLDDIGATNVEEALAYVANAETGQTFEASSNASWVDGGQATQPSRNRVRGLTRADTTSDFFATSNPHIDSYNIQRIAVVRGPNSILFGLGSPSGIINYARKKATTNKDMGQLRVALDNFGTVRSEIDFNRVLAEDKLAIRFMGVLNDKRFQYDDAHDRDKRATVALTYKPNERTEISFNHEKIEIDANRPRYIPPEDHITHWAAAGSPTIAPGENPSGDINGVPAADYFDELAHIAARNGLFFTDMNQVGPDYAIRLENVRPDMSRFPTSTRVFMRRSSNPQDGLNFYTPNHVTDDRVFPFRDIDLGSLPGSYQLQETDYTQILLRHRFSQDFNVEVGFQKDETLRENNAVINPRTSMIAVDVNETLTDGSVNPNFMRPFVVGREQGRQDIDRNSAFRVQASYELDLDEKFDSGFLGRHRFAALYAKSEDENYGGSLENVVGSLNHEAFVGENALLQNPGRRIAAIYYVGEALAPGQQYPTFTGFPNNQDLFPNGVQTTLRYYDDEVDGWVDSSVPIESASTRINGSRDLTENEGWGVTMQSFWLDGKLVTTLGYRDDTIEGQAAAAPTTTNGDRDNDLSNWVFSGEPDKNQGDTVTKGAVFHATDWLSVHYNESENFVVSGPAVDILNRPVPGSSGVGEDYGFSLNLLEDKLNLKVNWYETVQKDSRDGGLAFVAVWRMRGFERGIYSRINNGSWEEELTPEQNTWVRWDGSTENHDRLPNVTDVHDFLAKGVEIEMTYNPTKNWRFRLAGSKGETIQTNSGLATLEYMALREPFWETFWDLPWSSSRTVRQQFNAAVGEALYPALANDGRTRLDLAKWNWNFVTNYKFTDGRFKGFSAGGSVRWSDKRSIGYPLTTDSEGNLITDLQNGYFGPETWNLGLHASYGRKIFNDKIDWKIQLNIQNLNGDNDLIPIRINPDGQQAAFRVNRERIYRLSNTFSF
ncbi:TonB-dependent receptor plug domain-containing protein [Pelagicoccus enzymogenes]|uniref:TonB-dependent receptor plug domain-containing protein n=1 Tax=Pelagicoccus enzymogenes TaxID=2773457 RepID=UPI00280CE91E|nr:TonB-dependent receptor plug domain-containing protein [Pelagicoccus enzymogenes]MDQ8200641.1 TonB-dependent receptor plug domain-containing protein [Pelagicoccus enzymogenes]